MATSRYGWRSFEPGLARRSRSHSPQTQVRGPVFPEQAGPRQKTGPRVAVARIGQPRERHS